MTALRGSARQAGVEELAVLPDGLRRAEIVVVGAGIIGLSIALRLRQHGHEVVLIDREGVAAGASRGNAGAYAFSDILPLASPGLLRQLPRWLFDPLGPLSLPPSYLPRIAPWLWRFWRASRAGPVAASTRVLAALMRLSAAATPRLLDSIGALPMLRKGGNLHLYDSRAGWQAAQAGWQVRAEHGIALQHLHGRDEIAAVQPGLSPALADATFVPGWSTIEDPLQLCRALAAALHDLGATLARASASALLAQPEGVLLQLADGRELRAGRVVLAAGAWSHLLARTLGERVPLETERGYNTTLPPGAFDLRCQLTFAEHGFVITPIAGGVRVGGAVELAGLQAPPNFRRADALLTKARRFLPGLRTEGGTQWMGFRPSLPDSLPVIGPSAADARVIHAFGHGHLGLTLSAATAELVLEMIESRPPALDLEPLGAQRFGSLRS